MGKGERKSIQSSSSTPIYVTDIYKTSVFDGPPKEDEDTALFLRSFQCSGGLRYTSTCTNYNEIIEMVEKEMSQPTRQGW